LSVFVDEDGLALKMDNIKMIIFGMTISVKQAFRHVYKISCTLTKNPQLWRWRHVTWVTVRTAKKSL